MAEVTGVSEWCTTGDAELVDSKDGARFQLLSTATADRLRDRLLAAQQSWEEERARLTAERDEAERDHAEADAEAHAVAHECDALRHEWQAVIAALDGTSPTLGDPETAFRVDALRLRLEKVERLGEQVEYLIEAAEAFGMKNGNLSELKELLASLR